MSNCNGTAPDYTSNDYCEMDFPVEGSIDVSGCEAQLWIRDSANKLVAWAGTRGLPTPSPAPALVGTMVNLAPLAQGFRAVFGALSIPPGTVAGEFQLFDSLQHRYTSQEFSYTIFPDFAQGG